MDIILAIIVSIPVLVLMVALIILLRRDKKLKKLFGLKKGMTYLQFVKELGIPVSSKKREYVHGKEIMICRWLKDVARGKSFKTTVIFQKNIAIRIINR